VTPSLSMWINVGLVVIAAIGAGTISFTNVFGPEVSHQLGNWAILITSIVAAANVGMHGMSSPQSGPLYTPPKPPAPAPDA
jgi:hypothetical protein